MQRNDDAPLLAHVLFMDIVGATKLPTDDQRRIVARLRELVRASEEFQCAKESNQLISVPTGDGMALAFFNRLDAAVLCAVEVTKAIQAESLCNIRMGVHTGPVYVEEDIRGQPNLNGAGINLAERVMSAGGAGHILVSDTVAASLKQLGAWRDKIHEVGDCQVKDGWIHVWNLVNGPIGNASTPKKTKSRVMRRRWMIAGAAAVLMLIVAAAAGSGALWFARTGPKPVEDRASIAVLPFKDDSPQKNQEPFAAGLTEDLRTELTRVPGLKVAGRESCAKVLGADYREMGQKLNVAALLEGTVLRYSDQVRVTVRLIKSADGFAMWSENYGGQWSQIFKVQADISQAVAKALSLALLPQQAAPGTKTSNVDAYNATQMGRRLLERGRREDLEKAAEYLEKATKLDPQYALAWQTLAEVRSFQIYSAYLEDAEEGKRKMRQAEARALEINPNLAEALATLGWTKMNVDWDWAAADTSFKRARELAPGYLPAIKGAAQLAVNLGRLKEGVELHKRAVAIDPLIGSDTFHLALAYYDAGDLTHSKEAFEKTLELDSEFPFSHCYFCQVYIAQSKYPEALSEAEKEKYEACRIYALALVYWAMGRTKDSDAQLAAAMAKYPKDMPYQIAEIYAFRGQKDQAVEWLRKAYEATDTGIVLMKVDPLLKNLHGVAGYNDMLKKMNLQD